MKLRKLLIENFGPFHQYEIEFPKDDNLSILLTGKNNEGKSTIINSLKFLHNATKVVKKYKYNVIQDLLKQDVEGLELGRLLHNYEGTEATITGTFSNNFQLQVTLDASTGRVFCRYSSNIPKDVSNTFGIIPPLGLLAEEEFLISNISHLTRSLSTSLAPRHLRNHFYHFLNPDEFSLVKEIVNDSWENIKLLNYEYDNSSNKLMCFYKENRIDREISWAGLG